MLSMMKPWSAENPGAAGGDACARATRHGATIARASAAASSTRTAWLAVGVACFICLRLEERGTAASYERGGAGSTPTTRRGLRRVNAGAQTKPRQDVRSTA